MGRQRCGDGRRRLTQGRAAGAAEGMVAPRGLLSLCPQPAPSQRWTLMSLTDEELPIPQSHGGEAAGAASPPHTESGLALPDWFSGEMCTHAG